MKFDIEQAEEGLSLMPTKLRESLQRACVGVHNVLLAENFGLEKADVLAAKFGLLVGQSFYDDYHSAKELIEKGQE